MNVRPSNTTNSNSTIPIERSEVLYGTENAKNLLLQIASQAKRRIDICDDYTIPSVNIPAELFKRLLSQAKSEQIRFRYLTEIIKIILNTANKLWRLQKFAICMELRLILQ